MTDNYPPEGRGFPCEAYGDLHDECFFDHAAGECETRLECSVRMSYERARMWARLQELAASAPDAEARETWAEILSHVEGPGDLLNASPDAGEAPA